jgi:hypothetical protein
MKEKRKTINGDDLIWSMGTLGFEDYVEPLKLYLKLYREVFPFSPCNTLPGGYPPPLLYALFLVLMLQAANFCTECLRYTCEMAERFGLQDF